MYTIYNYSRVYKCTQYRIIVPARDVINICIHTIIRGRRPYQDGLYMCVCVCVFVCSVSGICNRTTACQM